ncbi:hypothetical protein ACMBCM_05975, partial [Spiroplasma sp. K1]
NRSLYKVNQEIVNKSSEVFNEMPSRELTILYANIGSLLLIYIYIYIYFTLFLTYMLKHL